MPHVINGNDEFSESVQVPDGGDSGLARASDVELIGQKLLNNDTHLSDSIASMQAQIDSLQAQIDALPAIPGPVDLSSYARKNLSNTFTAAQTIQSSLNVKGSINIQSGGSSPPNLTVPGLISLLGSMLGSGFINITGDITGDDITATGHMGCRDLSTTLNAVIGTSLSVGNVLTADSATITHNLTAAGLTATSGLSGDSLTVAHDIKTQGGAIRLRGDQQIIIEGDDDQRRRFPRLSLFGFYCDHPERLLIVNRRIVASTGDVILYYPIYTNDGNQLVSGQFRYAAGGSAVHAQIRSRKITDWFNPHDADAQNIHATETNDVNGSYVDTLVKGGGSAGSSTTVNNAERDYWFEISLKQGNELLAVRFEAVEKVVGGVGR